MVRSARFKLIVGTGRRLRQDGYQTAAAAAASRPLSAALRPGRRPGRDHGPERRPRPRPIKEDLLDRMYERHDHDARGPRADSRRASRGWRRSTGAWCRATAWRLRQRTQRRVPSPAIRPTTGSMIGRRHPESPVKPSAPSGRSRSASPTARTGDGPGIPRPCARRPRERRRAGGGTSSSSARGETSTPRTWSFASP